MYHGKLLNCVRIVDLSGAKVIIFSVWLCKMVPVYANPPTCIKNSTNWGAWIERFTTKILGILGNCWCMKRRIRRMGFGLIILLDHHHYHEDNNRFRLIAPMIVGDCCDNFRICEDLMTTYMPQCVKSSYYY